MEKLVVLKLNGDVHLGVWGTLEIGPEGARPETEVTGSLPKAPELVRTINQWHSTYRSIVRSARLEPPLNQRFSGLQSVGVRVRN